MGFSSLLQEEGQAYFDRTRYISTLQDLHRFILFCRPRRFGKSLTVSMLEHFHGLQYASEHQSLYKVCNNVLYYLDMRSYFCYNYARVSMCKKTSTKVNPGQYLVLTFDFSEIRSNPDLTEANKTLVVFLNSCIETFYETYAAYLGESCGNINSEEPNVSLRKCVQLVQHAIEHDERLDGIKGIYVLVDEYDSFPNKYLEPPNLGGAKATEGPKISWENTAVEGTFTSFWATIKALCAKDFIQRIFITGISPLSLSSLGSAFNISRNLSFHRDLSGLCGLTYADLKDALKGIYEDPKDNDNFLSEMTKSFNGFHFCKDQRVGTVYNTETCLAYLQCRIEGVKPETIDPENSEVSELFLRRFAAAAPLISDFEEVLKRDDKGDFKTLKYQRFKSEFTLRDLVCYHLILAPVFMHTNSHLFRMSLEIIPRGAH